MGPGLSGSISDSGYCDRYHRSVVCTVCHPRSPY